MTVHDVATTVGEDNAGPRPQARRALGGALVVAVLAVVLDQASKALAVAQLTPGERVPLLGDLFGLSLSVRSLSAVMRGVDLRRFRQTRPTPSTTETSATFPTNRSP